MAIRFSVSAKKMPTKDGMKTVFCPRLLKSGTVTLREISRDLSDGTTLSKADIYAVMIGLAGEITKHLLEGRVVEIEDLGTFRLSAKTSAAEDAEGVSAKLITKPGVDFRPSLELKRELRAAKFLKKK